MGQKGNQKNLRYFSEAYERGKLSHAYILEGSAQSGKEEFAQRIAAALLCENARPGEPLFPEASGESSGNYPERNRGAVPSGAPVAAEINRRIPCGKCPSCVKAATGNHPDIIHVRHEKSTVLSVGEIREQVVTDIAVKPYYGPYKIYLIHDAQLMNENAQNALLKTIEEPESYGLLFLLTDNADSFLQTIRSRCVRLHMKEPTREQMAEHLLDAEGQQILRDLVQVRQMDALSIQKTAKEWEGLDRQKILRLLKLWFRDVLVDKSAGDGSKLYFLHDPEVAAMAKRMNFEGLNRVLLAVEAAQLRLQSSVKAEAVFETLLLTVRKEQRS